MVALAAILREVLSPGGSSESARATRLATLGRCAGCVVRQKFPVFGARAQTKHLSMVVDSGAEVHLVCPAHKHLMKNVTKLTVPLQLETAAGDVALDTIGDLLCRSVVCHGCVFSPIFSDSLFSTARGEKDGYFCERCPEGYGVLKGPKGDVKLERAGGLDYLVGGEEQCVFLLCSHLATCTSMTTRGRQHRRQGEREMAGAGGEVCADPT